MSTSITELSQFLADTAARVVIAYRTRLFSFRDEKALASVGSETRKASQHDQKRRRK